jgi:copper chaperone
MTTVELTAPDISCDHCKHHIEHDLAELDGVARVVVTVPDQRVLVDYDDARLGLDAVRVKMTEIGYPPA